MDRETSVQKMYCRKGHAAVTATYLLATYDLETMSGVKCSVVNNHNKCSTLIKTKITNSSNIFKLAASLLVRPKRYENVNEINLEKTLYKSRKTHVNNQTHK